MSSLAPSERRYKLASVAGYLGIAALFLITNRTAYRGYFQDDDLDTLSWAYRCGFNEFIKGWLTPIFAESNFRPTGHFYYWAMVRLAAFDFAQYVAVIQALHLLNIALLWALLRKLEVNRLAAAAGALFFGFNIAVFHIYWRPMYVFDLTCGTFCLLSLLLYAHKRFVYSFLCFWLAYKAKEVAVVLPAVLLCFEFWLGEKKWLKLIPFFAVSFSFGIQALQHNMGPATAYTLHLTPSTFLTTIKFYAGSILMMRYAGFLLLLLPVFFRDRRVYFGTAAMILFLVPMLALPGRLFAAYLYVPLIGLTVAVAAIASRARPRAVTAFFLLWLPYSYLHLCADRNRELAIDEENHAYAGEIARIAPSLDKNSVVIYDGKPAHMEPWGVRGAIYCFSRKPGLEIHDSRDPEFPKLLAQASPIVLSWDAETRKLDFDHRAPGAAAPVYVDIQHPSHFVQFGQGWWDRTGEYRWISPIADATIWHPANARQFEIKVNVGPQQIEKLGHFTVEALADGRLIGRREFTMKGWRTVRWDVPPAAAGLVKIEFRVNPEFHPGTEDKRTLGVPIAAFGFIP